MKIPLAGKNNKVKVISASNTTFIKELKAAIKQVALAKKEKIKLKSAQQLFGEL